VRIKRDTCTLSVDSLGIRSSAKSQMDAASSIAVDGNEAAIYARLLENLRITAEVMVAEGKGTR
jgi:hypothetical protein